MRHGVRRVGMTGRLRVVIVLSLCWVAAARAPAANAQDAANLAPWLDLPVSWTKSATNGVVAAVPGDLAPGSTLVMLVEPLSTSTVSIQQDYEQALRDLGPWRPVGEPIEQRLDGGWVFRFGVGVATLDTGQFTAQTAVARHGNQRVRFWVLADSDATFNRYQKTFLVAISSAQDSTTAVKPPPAAPGTATTTPLASGIPRTTPTLAQAKLPTGFGEGVSGVYVGIERGLRASAGIGSGPQQVFNPSTGRYETSNTGTGPQLVTQVSDYTEVDVFFPDGTYRRRLPLRGLYTDLDWEKTQQVPLWGTWVQDGDQITVKRKPGKYEVGVPYTTTYTLKNGELISSRGNAWVKLPMQTGVRLEGTYARHDYRKPGAPRVEFHADGTFREIESFLDMVGSPWHMAEPDMDARVGKWSDEQIKRAMVGGRGTYSFDDFTLTCKTDDGRVWQINAYIPAGESPPKPKHLIINGYQLLAD